MSTTQTKPKISRPRGATRQADSIPVTIWVPKEWRALLQTAIRMSDTDRSKFTREALREKLARAGMPIPNPSLLN